MPPSRKKARKTAHAAPGRRSAQVKEQERVKIDYTRLAGVTKVLKLESIDMLDTSYVSLIDPRRLPDAPEGSGTGYSQGIIDARWFRLGTQLDVVLGFRVVAHLRTPEVSGHRDMFSLTARFLVSYTLPEDLEIADEDEVMADLVMANGQINSFPYFRQLVVENTARAGWPPLTLDVLRAPASRVAGIVRNAPAVSQPTAALASRGTDAT